LRIEVLVKAWRTTAVRMEGTAFVDGKRVAEAIVTCRLVPRVPSQAEENPQDDGTNSGS